MIAVTWVKCSLEGLGLNWLFFDGSPLQIRYTGDVAMAQKITKLFLRNFESRGKTRLVYDSLQTGFGVRVTPSERQAFFFEYSLHGWRSPRRMTMGKVGDLTLDQARAKARVLRELVSAGRDPMEERNQRRSAPTMESLAKRFMEEHAAKKAPSTRRGYSMLWDLHILPALGTKKVVDVRWEDIEAIHRSMRATPYQANRMLSLVSKAFRLAARWGWYPRSLHNPGLDHDKYREDKQRGQALTGQQLEAVGRALAEEPGGSIPAACLQTVLLTGARPGEILKARWNRLEMDGRLLRLKEAKTGPRAVFLGRRAAEIVAQQPPLGPYLFAGREQGKPMFDLKAIWRRLKERAELPERVRLYDAGRHTFVSTALELGISLDRVKILAGHALSGDITARYTHYRPDRLLDDADRVAEELSGTMFPAGLIPTGQSLG